MNLDEFIFSDNISTPAGMSPSPELKKEGAPKSTNAVASAIPIKLRKESAPISIPQSVPAQQHGVRNHDEFGYVQRHFRKTSIDERRVRTNPFTFSYLTGPLTYSDTDSEASRQFLPSSTPYCGIHDT
jgi:GATA-binding protein, other eukaryote